MPSAAERFYERSHQVNKQRSQAPQIGVAELTAAMRQPSHRYYPVLRYLEANPGLNVVELGFGDAITASTLAQACGHLQIIDVADRREGIALPGNVAFTKADLNDDYPLPGNTFDVVVAMMVIEHLFDPFHSFGEVFRIAKPGGRVFINLPNIGSIRCRLQLLRGGMPVTSSNDWFEKREWDGNHLHYFTVDETIRLASFTGLKLEQIHPVGGHRGLKKLRPSLFCHEISYEFSKPA
jgi:SAM-dependent methyltransferase